MCIKKARLGGLGIGICPTHSEIDLLCKSVKYALRRVKQASPVKYFLRKCECKMDFRFWRKSILHSHFRRKYFTGGAYFTRREAYFTDLQSKSISLWVGHIPMPNPPRRTFFCTNPGSCLSISHSAQLPNSGFSTFLRNVFIKIHRISIAFFYFSCIISLV